MKRNTKRLPALLLAILLCLSLLPGTASAQEPDLFIFGYQAGGGPIVSVSTADQSDRTEIAEYDQSLLGLEIIDGKIYGLSLDHSFSFSNLVILNPDFTVQKTVGTWLNDGVVIVDTAVQNGTLWGTYNDEFFDSYLIPISLTTGQPDDSQKGKVIGLAKDEIIYTIACNRDGQMYAIAADGGENGGLAKLYTINASTFEATEVGSTKVNVNGISSSAFAPDGTLYWAENTTHILYTVNTTTGKATAVAGGGSYALNAMMIPSDGNTAAYVNFTVKGEAGTIAMGGQPVTGLQKVTAGGNLELTFTPGTDNKVKEVVVDGEKQGPITSYTLTDVSAWARGIHTVEVTFQSRNISIVSKNDRITYLGANTLNWDPSFEATLYFTVTNGPARHTGGVSNYGVSIEKDGNPVDRTKIVPGTYDIHVTREGDAEWNALDIVLNDTLTITKQCYIPQWSDLELTAHPGDTLANVEKPAYLVSSADGKQIPGTFFWIDDESTSVGDLGEEKSFSFRFKPDQPLSEELAALYDFSGMPEEGFTTSDEYGHPFTAKVKVVEDDTPGVMPISLPVRTFEEGDKEYVLRVDLSAAFQPDTAVTAEEMGEYDGLRIDYVNGGTPSQGYDFQAEYHVAIPLKDYAEQTLSGTLTVPLPEGYEGTAARIKDGASASAYTADTVSFPVTLNVESGKASAVGLMIEYKKAKESVATPVVAPGGGTFTGSQTVTLSCATVGAEIHYTTNGTEPTAASTKYDAPFTITETTTVKAIAVKEGMADSAVLTVTFTKYSGGGSVGGGSVGGSDSDDGYSVSIPAGSSIRGGAITVSPRSADRGDTVTITVKPDAGYELDELTVSTRSGGELALTNKGNDRYTFTMPASDVKIQVSFREIAAPAVNPFIDVSASAYYYDAVLWAVEHGITNGTTATTFSPDVTVTRAQMVTFLWRAHGSPRATGSNPFTDVSTDAYYYDAVLWAVANGITNGTTATTFSPNAPVTRAQAVTFQWRAAGSPAVSGGSFADVAADAYYAGVVSWAVANGITNGTTATTFSPNTPVSRAQAVTFLYRELA